MKTKHLLLISGTILLVMVSCGKNIPKSEINEQVVCVKTEVAFETTAAMPVQCSGILSSKHMSKLSFKTGGIIAQLLVEEGSLVKKGQLLAALNMTEISAQVRQAKVAFEKADRDLKRVKNLYTDTVATLEQLQNATSAYEAALENKNIAEFNLHYSRIVAPDNGRIIGKLGEENELVGPGMPVLIFSGEGNDEWVIKTGISDKDIVILRKGDKAEIEFDAFPEKVFQGIISRTSEAANPSSGTFEIEIAMNPSHEKFINGLVAKVKIKPANKQKVTIVPPEALTGADGNKGYVYIAETGNSTARKIPVTITYIQNNGIAVLEPLNKIGPVITKGSSYIENGSKINITR